MSDRTSQPFLGAGYRSPSLPVDAQRCVNFILEIDEKTRKGVALYGSPGLSLFLTLPGLTACRPNGFYVSSIGRAFVIQGTVLYEIFNDATFIERGRLGTTSGLVDFVDNGAANTGTNAGLFPAGQMLIRDDISFYCFVFATNVLSIISTFVDTTVIPPMSKLTYQGGYAIASQTNSPNVWISHLYDFSQWDSLDYAVSAENPNNLVGVISNGTYLWLLGTNSTTVFSNSGAGQAGNGTAFPFSYIGGTLTQYGSISPGSIAQLNTDIFFLGGGNFGQAQVFKTGNNLGVQRISTHAIESYIKELTESGIASALGFTQEWRGHLFYYLTFSNAESGYGKTFCYDVLTDSWSERAFLFEDAGVLGRHLANGHVLFNYRHYVTDFRNGNIYEWSDTTYTDNGTPLVSRRDGFHINKNEDYFSIGQLQVWMQAGVGLDGVTDPDSQFPTADLYVSKNYGYSYGPPITAQIGAIGQYKQRVCFNRLGSARDMVYSFRMSSPVKRVINGCTSFGGSREMSL